MNTIIFDFDGTLADTLPVIYDAFQKVFKTYQGRDLNDEDIKAMFGPSEDDILKKELPGEQAEAAIEQYHKLYRKNHSKLVKRSDDIEKLLQFIKSKGLNLAVVTGKGKRSLELSLEALGMAKYFDTMVTGDDVTKPKPDPEGVLKVIETFGTTPEETIFIGDSDADMKAGKSAGVTAIGVNWLPNVQTSVFETKPDQVFKQVSDFKTYLTEKI
jgi:pyrophosphatase PpaX